MVDEEALFEELAVVGEVHAEEFRVTAGAGESDSGDDAYHVAAEEGYRVPEGAVAPEYGGVPGKVDGVVVPRGVGDDGEFRVVADDEFHIVGVGAAALVVQIDDGLGTFFYFNDDVGKGGVACARPGGGDLYRFGGDRAGGKFHIVGFLGGGEGLGPYPVDGGGAAAHPGVGFGNFLGRGSGDFHVFCCLGREGAVVEPVQAS